MSFTNCHSSYKPNRCQDGVQAPSTQPDQQRGRHGCECHFISARQTSQIVDSFGTQNVWRDNWLHNWLTSSYSATRILGMLLQAHNFVAPIRMYNKTSHALPLSLRVTKFNATSCSDHETCLLETQLFTGQPDRFTGIMK